MNRLYVLYSMFFVHHHNTPLNAFHLHICACHFRLDQFRYSLNLEHKYPLFTLRVVLSCHGIYDDLMRTKLHLNYNVIERYTDLASTQ